MGAESNNTFWSEKLLELNKKQNLSYSEIYDFIADMEIYVKVAKEEESRLKTEIEKKQAEYAYKIQIRDTLRALDEELDKNKKLTEELIKMKKCNNEIRSENYDLKKQRILEREKREKILERRWNESYQESMRIIELDPSVIKRNQLRNKNAQLKFQIAYMKQKMENLKKRHIQFKKIEKQIEQNNIIQFAEAMVKYNKKQKEKELNDANISKQNKTQELNVSVTTEKISTQLNLKSIDRSQNDFKQKTLMESFKLSIQSLQLPSFDPKNYLNMNFLTTFKPETRKEIPKVVLNNLETPKLVLNSLNIPKPSFMPTLPKIDILTKPVQENKLLNHNKQKLQLEGPVETQEPKAKRKALGFPETNSSTEKGEHVLSQLENKNPSQSDKVISSSQDDKKNTQKNQNLSDDIPQNVEKAPNKPMQPTQIMNILSQNKSQMFNFPANIPMKPIMNEIQKPPPLGQMFNLTSTKKVETVPQKPKSTEFLKQNYTQNQMFNIPSGAPKRTENVPDTPLFSNVPKPMETKSPYFANQSSQNDQSSLNTSTNNSDRVANVSSDQHPSQISGEEYFEASENVQMQEEINPNIMEYNNADPNMIEYFGSNLSPMLDMGEEQAASPYSLPGFQSPPNEEHLRVNQQINSPTPANNIQINQNNSNNFFDFGQSSNTKSNNIFSLF